MQPHPNLGQFVKSVAVVAANNDPSKEMFTSETDCIFVAAQNGADIAGSIIGSNDNFSTSTTLYTFSGVKAVTVTAVKYQYVKVAITGQPAALLIGFDMRKNLNNNPSHFVA